MWLTYLFLSEKEGTAEFEQHSPFKFKCMCILYQDVTSGYNLVAPSSAVLSGGVFSYSIVLSNFSSTLFIICGITTSGKTIGCFSNIIFASIDKYSCLCVYKPVRKTKPSVNDFLE